MDEQWGETFDQVYDEFVKPNEIEARRKKLKKRAASAHPILIALAKKGKPGDEQKWKRKRPTTEYGKLAEQIGSNSSYIWKVLVTIDKIGAKYGDPPVSPLVETAKTAGPGHGYFKWRHLSGPGTEIPDEKAGLTQEQKAEWRGKLQEVYNHDDWYWSQ